MTNSDAVARKTGRHVAARCAGSSASYAGATARRLSRVAAASLAAPMAFAALLDGQRWHVAGSIGLPDTFSELHVRALVSSLVADLAAQGVARAEADVRGGASALQQDLGIVAWLAVPLEAGDGRLLGVLAVADVNQREWAETERAIVADLAATLSLEVELHSRIAEHEQHQPALGKAEERFHVPAEAMGAGVAVVNNDGTWRYLSPFLEELLGQRAVELIGRPSARLIHPDDRLALRALVVDLASDPGSASTVRLRCRDKFGAWRRLQASIVNLCDQPVIDGLLVIAGECAPESQPEARMHELLRQQAALAELGQRALASADLRSLMEALARSIAEVLDVEYCGILELLPDSDALVLRAAHAWPAAAAEATVIAGGPETQAGHTLAAEDLLVVSDLREETRFSASPLLAERGAISGVSLVIPGLQRPFGVLDAYSTRQQVFSNDQLSFLRAAIKILATAIERRHAEEALRRVDLTTGPAHERLLERLVALAQAMGASRDNDSVLRALREFITSSVPCNGLFISRYHPERQERSCMYAWADGQEVDVTTLPVLPMSDSPHSRAIATGQVIVTNDLQAALQGQPHVDLLDVDPRLPQSSMAVPMAVPGRVLGAFEIQSVEPAAYTREHMVALRMAASLAAVAIENTDLLTREQELRIAAQASEEALRDSESRLRLVFEQLPAVLWTTDQELRITSVVAGGSPALQRSYADTLGKTLYEVFKTRDEGEYPPLSAHRLALEGKSLSFDVDLFERTFHGYVRPFYNAEGEIVGCIGVAQDITDRKRMEQRLAQSERQLHDLVGRILVAQEEERRRVAYELHDGVAQLMASVHQHLQAFASRYRPRSPETRVALEQALLLAQQTVKETRRVVAGLRPTVLDDFGLARALQHELDLLRDEGWHISYLERIGPRRLPSAIETGLFRIAQEALRNIAKHSLSSSVEVVLEQVGQTLRLTVSDDGIGFDPATLAPGAGQGQRIGLRSMQERAALLGGQLLIASQPGGGTTVTASIPCSTDEDSRTPYPPPWR